MTASALTAKFAAVALVAAGIAWFVSQALEAVFVVGHVMLAV